MTQKNGRDSQNPRISTDFIAVEKQDNGHSEQQQPHSNKHQAHLEKSETVSKATDVWSLC